MFDSLTAQNHQYVDVVYGIENFII